MAACICACIHELHGQVPCPIGFATLSHTFPLPSSAPNPPPQALLQLGDVSRLEAYERALDAALGAEAAGAGAEAGDSPAAAAEVVVADGSMALALVAACHPAVGAVTLLQVCTVCGGGKGRCFVRCSNCSNGSL